MTSEADQAIEGLNGRDMNGRALNVNEARPREERAVAFGGGGDNAVTAWQQFGGGQRRNRY